MSTPSGSPAPQIQRPAAEALHADELDVLATRDKKAKVTPPDGWRLSPQSVVDFVVGTRDGTCAPKFVGERAFVERCVVALATNRGLMLIGQPGTAKSYLSELLAAAISGDSTLTIQGSASTTDDAIKYSWNYALLLASGPSQQALVPGPMHRGMTTGQVVRFEEITRCPIEVQDSMLSILSDRVLAIPELDDADRTLYAARGFNVIATANTRDRGVNEMSAALKRRFNFETVRPIADPAAEIALVQRQSDLLLSSAGVDTRVPADLTEVLVTAFAELRTGTTRDGEPIDQLSGAMSTAEAVTVAVAAAMQSAWFGSGKPTGQDVVTALVGTALKDDDNDIARLRNYFSRVVAQRSGRRWKELAKGRDRLDL